MPSVLDNTVYYNALNDCTVAINTAVPAAAGAAGDDKYTIIIIKMAENAAVGAPLEILTIKQDETAGPAGAAIPFIPLHDGIGGAASVGQADIKKSLMGHIDAAIQDLYSIALAAAPVVVPGAPATALEFIAALKLHFMKSAAGAYDAASAAGTLANTNAILADLSAGAALKKIPAAGGQALAAEADADAGDIGDEVTYAAIIEANNTLITGYWNGAVSSVERATAGTAAGMPAATVYAGGSSYSMKRRRRHRKKHNTKRRARK